MNMKNRNIFLIEKMDWVFKQTKDGFVNHSLIYSVQTLCNSVVQIRGLK